MKVVYVAGPFRGASHWEIAQNIHRAEALALEIWRLGAAAICPHANTAHFQDAAPDKVWLEGDLAILSRCDAVMLTPDWEKSSGARAERQEAIDNDLPIFHELNDLKYWLETRPEDQSPASFSASGNPALDCPGCSAPIKQDAAKCSGCGYAE